MAAVSASAQVRFEAVRLAAVERRAAARAGQAVQMRRVGPHHLVALLAGEQRRCRASGARTSDRACGASRRQIACGSKRASAAASRMIVPTKAIERDAEMDGRQILQLHVGDDHAQQVDLHHRPGLQPLDPAEAGHHPGRPQAELQRAAGSPACPGSWPAAARCRPGRRRAPAATCRRRRAPWRCPGSCWRWLWPADRHGHDREGVGDQEQGQRREVERQRALAPTARSG